MSRSFQYGHNSDILCSLRSNRISHLQSLHNRDVRPWPWHLRPWPCHLLALNGKAKACRVTMPKDKSRLMCIWKLNKTTDAREFLQYLKRAYKHKWGSKLLCDDYMQ